MWLLYLMTTPLWHFHKPLRIFKSQRGKEKWTFTGHSWVTNYCTSANKFVSFASHPLWSLCIIFQHLSDFSFFLIIFSFPTSGQHRIIASPTCLAGPSLLLYEFLSLLHGHNRTNPSAFLPLPLHTCCPGLVCADPGLDSPALLHVVGRISLGPFSACFIYLDHVVSLKGVRKHWEC